MKYESLETEQHQKNLWGQQLRLRSVLPGSYIQASAPLQLSDWVIGVRWASGRAGLGTDGRPHGAGPPQGGAGLSSARPPHDEPAWTHRPSSKASHLVATALQRLQTHMHSGQSVVLQQHGPC